MNTIFRSIFQLFFPVIAGGIVGFLISFSMDYGSLNLPLLAPPKIVFPIAWTILYLLMGLAFYLFQKKTKQQEEGTIKLYYGQLLVNLLWSIIFFVFKFRLIAVLWILLLVFLVIKLIKAFYQKDKLAAYLLLPYLLWILFATYLTIGIWLLN